MKKPILRLTMFLVIVAIVFTGCKKYEEGPSFTLLSKKARMANDWKITKVTRNGSDVTSSYSATVSSYSFKIEKSGSYSSTTSGSVLGTPYTSSESGNWAFSGDKESVTFTETSPGSSSITFKIIELKNKEMILEEIDGSDTYRYTYQPN
jgi:hypothetical protein